MTSRHKLCYTVYTIRKIQRSRVGASDEISFQSLHASRFQNQPPFSLLHNRNPQHNSSATTLTIRRKFTRFVNKRRNADTHNTTSHTLTAARDKSERSKFSKQRVTCYSLVPPTCARSPRWRVAAQRTWAHPQGQH